MGTRNVTIIKYNGEERVRQYGQWDGYPTTALAHIVKFLKTNGAIEHLKRNLVKCKLVSEDKFVYPKNFDAIGNGVYKHYADLSSLSYLERMDKLAELLKVSKKAIFEYYLATRDTGYYIPSILITSAADRAKEIVLQQAYTDKCDWQIEAVNVIDLDSNRLISCWHDAKMVWDLNCLPDENEIAEFEKEG